MNIKKYIIIFVSDWVFLNISSFIGNSLEGAGILTPDKIGETGMFIYLSFYLLLFWVLVFSVIPIALHFFIKGQTKLGNGELPAVKSLQKNFRRIVYSIWGVLSTLAIILSPIAVISWMQEI